MATLNIKNFPDPLYETLQKQAEQEHRSVAQEVVHLLEHATNQAAPLSILELRGLGKDLWMGIDPKAHIQAERDSGRDPTRGGAHGRLLDLPGQ